MAAAKDIQYEGHHLHNFYNFKLAHGKAYRSSDEEGYRRRIFDENVRYIVSHNRRHKAGEKSYHIGVNHLTDWTHDEFKKIYSVKLSKQRPPAAGRFQSRSGAALQSQIDWREKGYVTPVKDQGHFGNCWTFSATGSLEGQHYKATRYLVSLSEQQLVDCCPHASDGGGNVDTAFDYIHTCGGIEPEEKYPYKGKQDTCRFERAKAVVRVKGFHDIERGSEKQLQEAVATIGPISVAIDASPKSFMLYAGGIYDEPSASTSDLDHAVLCVGYGEERANKYWIVKNSWGARWGEDGYIRMARNKHNQSGIATMASYPLVYELPAGVDSMES